MKHIATIIVEFVKYAFCKQADWWDELTFEQQEEYINNHENTEKRITAKHFISFVGKKYNQLKNAEQNIASVLKSILEDTCLDDQISLMKNIDDMSSSMQDDVDDITRRFRDLTQKKSNSIKESARAEFVKTKNREKFNLELFRAKLFDELYNKFSFVTKRKLKIDLLSSIADAKNNGNLSLRKAIVKNYYPLQKAISEWKNATKGITNADKKDFVRLLGLSKNASKLISIKYNQIF